MSKEPLQAVVSNETGLVENVIVCDQEMADQLNEANPPVFPGATLHDVTGRDVGVGWTFLDGEFIAPPPPPVPEPTPGTPSVPVAQPVTREEFDALMTMVLEAL